MPHDIVINVLFLCTGNSARSVMAEVLLAAKGRGRFTAFSAGSRPVGRVNPHTLATLRRHGLATEGLLSKSWDDFVRPGAPALDIIVTVCDSAANESCPIWPGRPATAHWSFPDPTAVRGDDAVIERSFEQVFAAIDRHIAALTRLPIEQMSPNEIATRLAAIPREVAA